MAAYTNLDTGQQKFYFAQIEKVHAGKTMEIRSSTRARRTGTRTCGCSARTATAIITRGSTGRRMTGVPGPT